MSQTDNRMGQAVHRRRANASRDDDVRTFFTEFAFRHLARYGLDFRPDVFEAIDSHLTERHERKRPAGELHPHGTAARL